MCICLLVVSFSYFLIIFCKSFFLKRLILILMLHKNLCRFVWHFFLFLVLWSMLYKLTRKPNWICQKGFVIFYGIYLSITDSSWTVNFFLRNQFSNQCLIVRNELSAYAVAGRLGLWLRRTTLDAWRDCYLKLSRHVLNCCVLLI